MANARSTYRALPDSDGSGAAKFVDVQDATTPGSEQTLHTEVVPAGKQFNLLLCNLACRQEGSFKVLIDSDIVASGRTGPAQPNAVFSWRPYRPAAAGATISVKFTAMAGKPSVDVEMYLQARELTL